MGVFQYPVPLLNFRREVRAFYADSSSLTIVHHLQICTVWMISSWQWCKYDFPCIGHLCRYISAACVACRSETSYYPRTFVYSAFYLASLHRLTWKMALFTKRGIKRNQPFFISWNFYMIFWDPMTISYQIFQSGSSIFSFFNVCNLQRWSWTCFRFTWFVIVKNMTQHKQMRRMSAKAIFN